MAVTVMELATHVLGREASTGSDFQEALLPMMGGCEVCGASVAAYNSCPSRTDFIRCASGCIEGEGYDTVEAACSAVFCGVEPGHVHKVGA